MFVGREFTKDLIIFLHHNATFAFLSRGIFHTAETAVSVLTRKSCDIQKKRKHEIAQVNSTSSFIHLRRIPNKMFCGTAMPDELYTARFGSRIRDLQRV
jgi:hypothetical protein